MNTFSEILAMKPGVIKNSVKHPVASLYPIKRTDTSSNQNSRRENK